MKIVLASKNKNKVKELNEILDGFDIEIVSVLEFPEVGEIEETGKTFDDNARIKADITAQITKLPSLADDSGLEVDFLAGAPGVHSARFSGAGATDEKNNNLLLRKLSEVPTADRGANFTCVIALAIPGEKTVTFEGKCFGRILREKSGDAGFGYDPLFFSNDLQSSFAVASSSEKNKVSHRARALAKLKDYLVQRRVR